MRMRPSSANPNFTRYKYGESEAVTPGQSTLGSKGYGLPPAFEVAGHLKAYPPSIQNVPNVNFYAGPQL